ncbi:MAG: helix-turn-helix domain-containing protein [Kofleriaceae bacterium]|nr:helix-turn-helix domain-containing protein [Kofleriaceae bacterium]
MTRDTIPMSPQVRERLPALGISIEKVAVRAGLAPSLRDELTTDEYFAFWRALARESDRPDLGLAIGAQASIGASSISSVAALQAPTFGDALRTVARYKRLCCPEVVDIEVTGGEARVRCHWLFAREEVPPLLVDGLFASFASLAKRGSGGQVAPIRVELARRSRHAQLLRAHFGCPIVFGATADRIVFAERTLAVPFITSSAEAFAQIVPRLEAELVARRRNRTLVDDARLAIARTISAGMRPSIDEVARRLRISARTLQRRLGEADTTFQAELDDVRRVSARRLLAQTELQPTDIAFLLGFEEPNSFARAFRTWERTTPLRWRAART